MRRTALSALAFVALTSCTTLDPTPDETEPASTSVIQAIPGGIRVGSAKFTTTGMLVEFTLPGGPNIVPAPHRPFVMTAGPTRYVVDSLSVVGTKLVPLLHLASSQDPARWVELSAELNTGALVLTVADSSDGAVLTDDVPVPAAALGLDTQFVLPTRFDCQSGMTSFSAGAHSCSAADGTIAAFCMTGNCDNRVELQGPSLASDVLLVGAKLGAKLVPRATRPLIGSGFALLTSGSPYRSLAFIEQVKAFKAVNGTTAENGSSLFLTSPPTSPCGATFCADSAGIAAFKARRLGFDELQLADYSWLRTSNGLASWGMWDPEPGVGATLAAISAQGVCPVLHSVQSALSPSNPLCAFDPLNASVLCPAALRGPDGQPVSPPGGSSVWLSDMSQPWVLERVASSMTQGAVDAGACGMYVDGSDWFLSGPLDAAIYYEELWRRAPSLRIWGNYSYGNAALFMTDMGIQDVWQVNLSESARSWALGWGYYAMKGLHETVGMNARLGWVPTPRMDESRTSYQPMLNAAVATGSYLTLQTNGDDPVVSGRLLWARQALVQATGALREIRRERALGVAGESSARHEVMNFTSGVSTIALFDSIVPATPGSRLEGRGFGVETVTADGACGPFASCFHFTGAQRMPLDYNLPKLAEKGSFLYHPAITTDSSSFTMAAWIGPDDVGSAGGLIERGAMGYGMNYYQGSVSAHFTPADGWGVIGFYEPVYVGRARGWKHVAVSYDHATRTITHYVDGVMQGLPKAMAWSDFFRTELPIFVGMRGDAVGGFKGLMNDLRLYDRALATSEISQIFAQAWTTPTTTDSPPEPQETDPSWLVGWLAGHPDPAPPTIEIDLGTQRVAYLVPMLEGAGLPAETIRLVFRGLSDPGTALVTSPVGILNREVRGDGALVIDVASTEIYGVPVRIAVE